jgi:hypothetical protein
MPGQWHRWRLWIATIGRQNLDWGGERRRPIQLAARKSSGVAQIRKYRYNSEQNNHTENK